MSRARLAALVCTVCATSAGADVSRGDAAKAKALFDEGQVDIDAGKIDAACTTFERSFNLDPQIGARLNLADCRERQGKLVEAYTLFASAADEAAHTQKQGRESFARQRMAALQAKLVRVTVRVAEPAPGFAVSLGERTLTQAQWATEQLVQPGQIVVDASAPGRQSFHVVETAVAGVAIEIDVPALSPGTEAPASPSPSPSRSRFDRFDRTTLILGGSGLGLMLASGVIGLIANSRYDSAKDADDRAGVSTAQHEADIATGVFVAGALVVAVGVVRCLRTCSDPDRVAIAPYVDGGTVGIAVSGSM